MSIDRKTIRGTIEPSSERTSRDQARGGRWILSGGPWDPRTIRIAILIPCLLVALSGCRTPPLVTVDTSGTWQGIWSSTTGDGLSGTVIADIIQNGAAISGSVRITNSPCELDEATISGSAVEDTITFGAARGDSQASFTVTLSGDKLSGGYEVNGGVCTGDRGLVTLLRQGSDVFAWPPGWTSSNPDDVRFGGVFTMATSENPATFNPFTSDEENPVLQIADRLGASLVIRGPDSDEYLPYAAAAIDISADGRTVDATLRDDVAWSDGTPVTAQDYVMRFQIEMDPDVGADTDWGDTTVEKTGTHSLRFNVSGPNRHAFGLLLLPPIPDHILGEIYRNEGAAGLLDAWGPDTDPEDTVWTSPWVPARYTPDRSIVLTRNPYFGVWNTDGQGNPLPYLDEVTYLITNDPLDRFLEDEIDAFDPQQGDLEAIKNAISTGALNATLLENVGTSDRNNFIVFNWNKRSDPFKENLFRSVDFRRAMSHLIDRQSIVETAFGGAAAPLFSSVPDALGFWHNANVATYPFSPTEASDLLAGLGFTETNQDGILIDGDGNALSFTLATNVGREQSAWIFADAARAIGVEVDVQTIDFDLLVEQLLSTGNDRPFDAILIGSCCFNRDWPFSSGFLTCDGVVHAWNRSGTCLSTAEQTLENLYFQGLATLDINQAKLVADQIQELEAKEQFFIYTVIPLVSFVWLDKVQGEHPAGLLNPLLGTRQLPLTWIRQP